MHFNASDTQKIKDAFTEAAQGPRRDVSITQDQGRTYTIAEVAKEIQHNTPFATELLAEIDRASGELGRSVERVVSNIKNGPKT